MATTMKLIAKSVLGSAATTVTISSIPATYTDLLLVMSVRSSTNVSGNLYAPLYYQFNSSTSGYSVRLLRGSGSAAGSSTETTASLGGSTWGRITYWGFPSSATTSSTFGQFEMYIPNYAGSTNKSWSGTLAHETNGSAAYLEAHAGLWSNTAAIDSIAFRSDSAGDFVADSSFFLYGITRVDDNTPGRFGIQATGGQEVYESGGYKYHVFKSSGTFTVSEPGWVECLVVAGGGGGGTSNGGGGGGGGGVLYSSGIFINSGSYLTTVGAGGVNSNGNDSSFLNFTAIGGGGGANVGSAGVPGPGYNGGSGGGGRYQSGSGGSALQSSVFGATGYGNIGGSAALSTGSPFPSAGGGGAGAAGGNTTSSAPGNGGNGIQIFGNYYSGGGGGTTFSTAASSTGGLGGGGNGPAGNGTANTGGGGAGDDNAVAGGIGGSGIVIIRYPI